MLRLSVTGEVGGALAGRYGVRAVPTTLVFDGAGQVIYSSVGVPDQDAVTAAVEQVLNR